MRLSKCGSFHRCLEASIDFVSWSRNQVISQRKHWCRRSSVRWIRNLGNLAPICCDKKTLRLLAVAEFRAACISPEKTAASRFSETAEIFSSEIFADILITDARQFRNRHLCRTSRLVACRSSTGRPETCRLVLRAGCRGLRLSNRRCGWASGDREISFPTAVTRFRLRR